jgi:agmatinase
MLIGIRASEPEELQNIEKNGLEFFTPFDIVEKGITSVAKRLLSKCKSTSVYLSIDLDCIDSGIAPGVSVPSACGLMPMELIYFIKKICSDLRIVGLDIVELSPKYDLNNNTANIGARLLMEAIASISIPKRKS